MFLHGNITMQTPHFVELIYTNKIELEAFLTPYTKLNTK
jgi:hypothetical protein